MMQYLLPALLFPAATPPQAAYTFALVPEGPAVRVTAQMAGDHDGQSRVGVLPEWGGFKGLGSEVTDLTATGRDGRPLHITRLSDAAWDVDHEADEPVTLLYTLREPADRPPPGQFNDYRTRVRPGLFQMIGPIGLILPESLPSTQPTTFSLRWTGFEEAGWTVASSFGPGSEARTINATPEEFRQSIFIAGALRCPTRRVHGNTIGVAICGDDWGFSDDRFADLAAAVIGAERDFFADHTAPWFLITLIPSGRFDGRGLSMGGTGLTNSFALFCNTGLDLSPGSHHEQRILHLLAHEHFHTWNGSRIHTAAPEGSDYWFSEGFTDFYARRLLFRAGLSSAQTFADEHNQSLNSYFSSPVRAAPNERIAKEFWTSRELNQLPYDRGNLVAMAVDEQMRADSAGRRCLDDFMRDLLADSLAGRPPANSEALLERIARETSPEFAAKIRACVIEGAEPPLPEAITEPPLDLKTVKMRGFDAGFDAPASAKSKVISGVREGSEAHKAGLRDGQKVLSMSISSGDASHPPAAELRIEDDAGPRQVRFDPLGPPVESRRLVPR